MSPKVIVITGASSGIGAALAQRAYNLGHSVALLARRRSAMEAIARDWDPARFRVLECDVTNRASVKHSIEQCLEAFKKIDIVIANAGFGVVGNVEDVTELEFRRQFETNVFGVLNTIWETIAPLERSSGMIGISGSVAGYVALPGASPYSMSKFAIRSLAGALYLELKSRGISVTHIAPGFVDSEIRKVNNDGKLLETTRDPLPSWLLFDTHKAARQILSAVLKRRREVIITGHGKCIVFLAKHFSGFVFFVMSRLNLKSRKRAEAYT